jgi:tripartite-type tricarboxylate transporter receptor subunit TctC
MNPFFKPGRRAALATLLQAGIVLAAGRAGAQTAGPWPQRPVKWIVSQPAGAGPDILARFVADQLSRVWGQAVVVDNRPGGQNVIGAQAAARSVPDGYTFFYGTTAAMVTNAFTFKALPYDPERDFVPVALVGRSPFVIAASPVSGFKTLAQVIAQARAKPDSMAIATEGPKTFSGMLADSVASLAGVKLIHVPYTRASDAVQDVLGTRVPLVCLPEAALASYIRNGQLVPLAASSAQRLPSLTTVPTLAETFAGFEYTGWNGLFAPADTPPGILARVNREVGTVLAQPDVVQRLQELGSMADGSLSLTAFAGFMKAERERWADTVKRLGVSAQ